MKDMNKAMKKLQESKKIKLENYSFSEIIDMMEEADSYSELYSAASKIKNSKLKSDVNELIGQCEDDGDDVETAYSIITSDLLDNKIDDLNEDKTTLNEDNSEIATFELDWGDGELADMISGIDEDRAKEIITNKVTDKLKLNEIGAKLELVSVSDIRHGGWPVVKVTGPKEALAKNIGLYYLEDPEDEIDYEDIYNTYLENKIIMEADEDNEEAKRDAYYERTYKRIEEYQKNLDLTPLFNWIKEVTGISDLKFNVERTNHNKDYRIEFESDNIIDKCGVMKFAFNDVRINSFGNGVTTTAPDYYDSEKIDYDKDYDLYYWVSLHFSYQLVEGGSNGCKFGRAMCKEGKWEFKLSNK